MNLKQLPYFIAIAETGSLSAAARRTGVSQPTISDYLHELEHELGTPLFERRQRRMLPTEAGAAYLQMARQVLILQTRAQDMIQNRHLQRKQSIRIGVSPHRGVQCLAALYQSFIKHFPQQEIEPMEGYMSGILEMLHAGKLDLGFATTANSAFDDSLCFLPTQQEEIVLALPAFHRLASYASQEATQAALVNLSEFQDIPFVLMSSDSTIGQASQQLFSQCGFNPVIVFQSSNVVMVNEMVHSGAGAGLIPAYYAKPSKDVVYLRLKDPAYLFFAVVWRSEHQLTEAERYLIYLKTRLWDSKNTNKLTRFLWSEKLRCIFQEFEPDYPIPDIQEAEPMKEAQS